MATFCRRFISFLLILSTMLEKAPSQAYNFNTCQAIACKIIHKLDVFINGMLKEHSYTNTTGHSFEK